MMAVLECGILLATPLHTIQAQTIEFVFEIEEIRGAVGA